MTLVAGTQFGRYEIRTKLGAGGMGEVYRARDNRLNRDVAIKVLLDSSLRDPDRMARFEREAQVLASLNHPNIAAIYGLEETNGATLNQVGLVMELIEGPTLADRLKAGPLPFEEALPIAKQIIDALEVAHERNIIHRDLKPANVKVTDDGVVKVLDFGLAKVFVSDSSNPDLSHSPTLLKGTEVGVILGTAAYMSPEQAKGKVVDKRSDIWAFGCVLFEMLTGKQPFSGETLTDTLASVVRGEPEWDQLPPSIPPHVKRLIPRCLEKDAKRRLRDIGDARYELDQVGSSDPPPVAIEAQRPPRRWASLVLVLALIAGAALLGAFISKLLARKPEPLNVVRVIHELPPDQTPSGDARIRVAISPDGKNLVYVAKQRLYLRPLNSLEAIPIAGTEGGASPFFSPDGKSIGFIVSSQVKRVPISGGTPLAVCNAEAIGASWGPDDTILLGAIYGGILRVQASGGTPTVLVAPKPGLAYEQPLFLPDGRTFLFNRGTPGSFSQNDLVMRSVDKEDETVLFTGNYSFSYLKSGIIVYSVGSTSRSTDLFAVAFDPVSRKINGNPITVVKNVQLTSAGSGAQFAISENGTLVYIPSSPTGSESRLVKASQTNKEELLSAEPRLYSDPRVSPDGKLVAAHLQGDENDVWVVSVERGTLTRLSFNSGEDETPAWSPDGRTVAWAASRSDLVRGIFKRPIDGSGNEELIWKLDQHAHVRDWTPDGRSIIYEASDPQTNNDIWRLSLDGQLSATPVLQTPYNEHNSRLSPDGKWIAYSSNESGRDEIYVRAFPQGGVKITVTTSGGDQPVWSHDGRMIFFRANGQICVIDFQPGPQPTVSNSRTLFADTYDSPQAGNHTGYDSFPDGKLLMLKSASEPGLQSTRIVMVLNWLDELNQQLGK